MLQVSGLAEHPESVQLSQSPFPRTVVKPGKPKIHGALFPEFVTSVYPTQQGLCIPPPVWCWKWKICGQGII